MRKSVEIKEFLRGWTVWTAVLPLGFFTLGLDVLARSELWDTIRSLKGKITIILTTHYMEEAEALFDYVAIMKSGKPLYEEAL